MKKIVLRIGGMSCSACSGGLEKYLNKQNGILLAGVNLVMASATVEYDDSVLAYEDIAHFVKDAGFECIGEYDKTEDKDTSLSKKQLVIFTVLAILMLYTAMGHMVGLPFPFHRSAPLITHYVSFALCIPFLYYGFDIIRSGIKNAVHLSPNMDTLVTLGIFSALIYSITVTIIYLIGITDTPPIVYFESVAIVIYFVKLGRFIDKKSKARTRNAISALVQITPSFAFIKDEGKEKRVPLDEVKEGDILICHPGERIAVDGEILKGYAHVDESFITGESKPSLKKTGDTVLAGSVNTNGYVEYLAKRVGKSSTVSEIVRLVLESTGTRPPIARVADRICLFFVPTVTAIAALTFIIHLAVGLGFPSAIQGLITVLVVACPCALGLATPLATVISEGELAKGGILIKKSEILEKASKLNTVIFDKTGTLTYGKMKVSNIIIKDGNDFGETMSKVCSLEEKSSHPIASAFKDYAKENGIILKDVSDFYVLDGYGIGGNLDSDSILLVNGRYLCENNIKNPFCEDEAQLTENGESIAYFINNGHVLALFGIKDKIREGISDEISRLKKMGIRPVMLTGDNEKTAYSVAREAGIGTVIAEVMPKDKADTVKRLRAEGKVCAMVGDGINDAIALSTADISVSIKGASDIAMDCADVILTGADIGGISSLIRSSEKTLKIIKQNLFLAFLYNSLMIPIAAGALLPIGVSINPMIASLAMVLSGLSVSLNSLRLIKRRK